MFMFQALKILPATIGPIAGDVLGVVVFGIGALLLVMIPFLDKRADRGVPNPVLKWIVIVVIIFVIAMTIWGELE